MSSGNNKIPPLGVQLFENLAISVDLGIKHIFLVVLVQTLEANLCYLTLSCNDGKWSYFKEINYIIGMDTL